MSRPVILGTGIDILIGSEEGRGREKNRGTREGLDIGGRRSEVRKGLKDRGKRRRSEV